LSRVNGQQDQQPNHEQQEAIGLGHRLGSSSALVAQSNRNASVQVRDHWSKRFGSSNTGSSSGSAIAADISKSAAVAVVTESNQLAADPRIISSSREESNSVSCPVCSTLVGAAIINQHLDECLTRSALAEEQSGPKVNHLNGSESKGVSHDPRCSKSNKDLKSEHIDSKCQVPEPTCKSCSKCGREVYLDELPFHRSVCDGQ